MENPVKSFNVDHVKLLPGVYVSRVDYIGSEAVTTFDVRLVKPLAQGENPSRIPSISGIHAFEHLGAYFFRSSDIWGPQTVYFGPMGCRTGCYVILKGEYSKATPELVSFLTDFTNFVINFDGTPTSQDAYLKIPGATAMQCGNYIDHDLDEAKKVAKEFKYVLENITDAQLVYP